MTKRMIDADALDKLLQWINGELIYNDNKIKCETCNNQRRIGIKDALDSVLEKINELATPASEPQGSIFDADGWCWDLKAIPKNTLIDLAVQCVKDKSINREVNYILNDNNDFYSSDYEHYLDDTYEFGFVIIAWRPMPNIPKEA